MPLDDTRHAVGTAAPAADTRSDLVGLAPPEPSGHHLVERDRGPRYAPHLGIPHPLGAAGAKTAAQFTTALSLIVDGRAENAAYIAAFQSTLQVLNSTAANELAAISQVENTDIAKEMMNLTAANIMTEAATAMLAQAMQMPNSVLKLLQ